MKTIGPLWAAMGLVLISHLAAQESVTTRAAVQKDLSTPKAAAMTFAWAMYVGDVEMARSAVIGDRQQIQAIEAVCALVVGFDKLTEAMKQKFGQAEGGLGSKATTFSPKLEQIERMEVHIAGDNATLGDLDSKQAMRLIRVNGEWKVVMDSLPGRERSDEVASIAGAVAKIAGDLAQEINQNKYRSADDAREAFQAKMMAALSSRLKTTAPATRPVIPEP